ncbi:MAG: UvrD-helicase domain-containing protein [Sandaracinaceae bacterium]
MSGARGIDASMIDAPMIDAEARARIASDLTRSFVVEAAAGTGKTTALIGRMVALLRSGHAKLDEIVSVTFTEKAAGEMKLRLRAELERALRDTDVAEERARFVEAMAALETARIGTIHAFCADLLREHPVEAGVDPAFEVISDDSGHGLLARAFRAWFEAQLASPAPGIRRALRRGGEPSAVLLRAARDMVERRDHRRAWRRPEGFDRDAEIDALVDELRSLGTLARLASHPRDGLAADLRELERFVAEIDAREGARPRDYDGIEANLAALRRERIWARTGFGARFGEGLSRADVRSRRDAFAERLDRFLELAGADLAAQLQAALTPLVDRYEHLKSRTGMLDFLDLLIRARDLVRDHEGVREELRARIRCVFVDEFQDTDPLQAEILLMLAADGPIPEGGALGPRAPAPAPGKLFVVGDPKQSIYRFRRADVALYESIKRRLLAQGVELLLLSTSFRARPGIQRAVNRAFEREMRGGEDGAQAAYVPLAPYREDTDARPSVIALPVPRPYGHRGKVWKNKVAESTADAVGAFVLWLVERSGWTMPDPLTHVERPIEARDVCLLFRKTRGWGGKNFLTPYADALEARGLPHVMVGGRTLGDREEVRAVVNALVAIEQPGDELAVYAALRGPFFALSDEELFLHRHAFGSLHPLARYDEVLLEPSGAVARALYVLRERHLERNRRPIADTLGRFLDATRAHAGVVNWPNGEHALANVLRILDLARRFESDGATSFRAFVSALEERIETGEGVDAPGLEADAAGVRLMTAHGAKGLEFGVVVLCDPGVPRRVERPQRAVDSTIGLFAAPLAGVSPLELLERADGAIRAEEAEEVRLSYVAATRARELLVVPCVGDAPLEGWVDPLHAALYPERDRRRAATSAVGCPPFGGDSVLDRPPQADVDAESSVMPGRHLLGDVDLVWWDPNALELGRIARGGLRKSGLLADAGGASDARIEAHLAWTERRARALDEGATVSWRARSVTAIAHDEASPPPPPLAPPRVERTDARRMDRPSGPRFGTLVHAVLAECPLDADEPTLIAMARFQGRTLDATNEEIDAAVTTARLTLGHPVLARARGADETRRECPIVLPLPDGTSAEGVIDLAFREGERWTVVDYKTDREPVADNVPYGVQVDLYARAVGAVTGATVERVLLYV